MYHYNLIYHNTVFNNFTKQQALNSNRSCWSSISFTTAQFSKCKTSDLIEALILGVLLIYNNTIFQQSLNYIAPLTSLRCSYWGLRIPLRKRSALPAPPVWFQSAVRPSELRLVGQTVACCSVPSLHQLHPGGIWRPGCSRSTSAPHPTSRSPPWHWRSCSTKRQLFDDLHSWKE